MARIGRRIFKPGERFEHYRIVKKLGEGGMGAVYQVYHPALDATFALKILFPDVAARDPEFVDRFVREARLSSRLRHPNLISVHDAGRDIQWGMYYLVMDFIDGGSVRQKLKQQGRMSPEDAFSVILQMLSALTEARKNGMVHRDIKPDNIMFTESGVVKLADLGIAKSTSECDATLTMESTVFGTPAYMSPEQAKDAKNVDCRADIYSLGIVFYEMLTGQCPYQGTPMAIVAKILSPARIPDIRAVNPQIPDEIARIVMKMCEKDLSARYAAPEEVIADMSSLLDEELTADAYFAHIAQKENTAPTSRKVAQGSASTIISTRETWEKEWRRSKKRKRFLYSAAAVFLFAGILYGIYTVYHHISLRRAEAENFRIQTAKQAAEKEAERIAEMNRRIQAEQQKELEHIAAVNKKIQEAKAAAEKELERVEKEKMAAEAEAKRIAKEKELVVAEAKQIIEKSKNTLREKEEGRKYQEEQERKAFLAQIEADKKMGIRFSFDGRTLQKYPEQKFEEKYYIPQGVTQIEKGAFKNCSNLKQITIPPSVQYIGDDAFYQCEGLLEISIPDSVKHIGNEAFYQCKSLRVLKIQNSVQHIGNQSFANCSNLTSVNIPDNITTLKFGLFRNCSMLQKITLKNVTNIEARVFDGCSNLNSVSMEKVETIGDSAFFDCSSLTNVPIPQIKLIEQFAFAHCKKLRSVRISKGVKIHKNAFFGVPDKKRVLKRLQ